MSKVTIKVSHLAQDSFPNQCTKMQNILTFIFSPLKHRSMVKWKCNKMKFLSKLKNNLFTNILFLSISCKTCLWCVKLIQLIYLVFKRQCELKTSVCVCLESGSVIRAGQKQCSSRSWSLLSWSRNECLACELENKEINKQDLKRLQA